ncbi:MAG: glycosyltransferase family 2 protein, partial [Planctomycetota bacterium]
SMTAVSIITVCRNSADVIASCLESVALQTHSEIEHIVIDGDSTDGTCKIIDSFPHVVKRVSEPDCGLYDAMNKGIAMATGEVVGILNSDDFYPNADVIATVAQEFDVAEVDATIGDVAFVSPNNLKRITRYYSAHGWHVGKLRDGFMPPHPAFFVRRSYYQQLGGYRTDYQISADFELLARFLYGSRLHYRYLHQPLVYMRSGGTSNASVERRLILNRELLRACGENGIQTSSLRLSMRYWRKIWEFVPWLQR